MKNMTYLELAKKVLEEEKQPLSPEEIWEKAKAKGYDKDVSNRGKTPWKTISSQIYIDIRDNRDSPFSKVEGRPTRFALKVYASEVSNDSLIAPRTIKIPFKEKDLHPFLTYYLYNYHTIYTKTIRHQSSTKDRFAEWLHPDMVGVYFSLESLCDELLEISPELGHRRLKLFSFEIKRQLDFNNLRESFFQAVSNSSWAHEGYLVAAFIESNTDFRQELQRLSNAFGIGIIQLDVKYPDESEILIPAREKESIDMETVNTLAKLNPDFRNFLRRIRTDLISQEIRRELYDKVPYSQDLEKLIENFANEK